MRKLTVSNNISLDGYFCGPHGELDWSQKNSPDPEWKEFVAGNARSGGMLVFGRVTYQMMAGFWPTPLARELEPVVAERMNAMPKLVFSRTLEAVPWANAELATGDLPETIRALKQSAGPDMAILGSGSLVAQLAPLGLIDEYHLIVNPVVLGAGRTLFAGSSPLSLRLTSSRTFGNGNVLLCYVPR